MQMLYFKRKAEGCKCRQFLILGEHRFKWQTKAHRMTKCVGCILLIIVIVHQMLQGQHQRQWRNGKLQRANEVNVNLLLDRKAMQTKSDREVSSDTDEFDFPEVQKSWFHCTLGVKCNPKLNRGVVDGSLAVGSSKHFCPERAACMFLDFCAVSCLQSAETTNLTSLSTVRLSAMVIKSHKR